MLLNGARYLDGNIREVDITGRTNSARDRYSYLEYLILDWLTLPKFNLHLKYSLPKILFPFFYFFSSITYKYFLLKKNCTCISLNISRIFARFDF